MKKFWRKVLIGSGSLVLVLLVLMALAALFLPVDRIGTRVEVELEKATGAQVTINGAGVQWWPRLGVTLKDITIEGNGPDLARASGSANELGSYSLRLHRFVIQLVPAPLLKKEILVDAVSLQGLQMKLVFKDQPIELEDADLAVTKLQISMEAVQEAGQQSNQSGSKLPVGESIPEELVLAFQGRAKSLLVQGLPLQEVKFKGDLDHRIVTVESLVAQLDGGQLSGTLEVDFEQDSRGWLDFDFQAQQVPSGVLLQPWTKDLAEKLETNLDATVRGNCILGEQDVVKQTLTLTGDVSSAEGTLWARDWLGDVAPYLGQRQDLADIHFHSLSHHLRVEQGKYIVEDLVINGQDTQWQGQGYVGLDGTIDLGVLVKLPSGFTPDLGQWSFMADTLRDENGRVNLNLHLTGMAAKPKVGLKLGSLQGANKSNSGEALKKGLSGLLDKWKSR